MKLQRPTLEYDTADQLSLRRALELADALNRKKNVDIELGQDEKLVIRSPNGTRYYLTVSNLGVLTATSM
jgi:hypothetical protein